MLVLVLPPVSSRVTGFLVASPYLWGKLQNMSFRHVSNCENWRKSRTKCWFWCSYVSCLESLVFLWRRRVYGGSCKTSFFRRFPCRLSCRFAWQAYSPTCLITCQMSKLEEVSHKTRDFFGGRGGGPSLLRRGEKRRSAMPRPGGPLAGFKRLRATAGQGPNYVGPFCGYVGLCWRMLAYLAGNVGPSCGYVGLCWPHVMLTHVEPKEQKNWNSKKNTVNTQDILMVGGLSWGYVGPSWGYVGPSWGQCGPILGLCWPILGLCWPSLGRWCPILGLSWPILGAMLAHLGAMLAHLAAYVSPCWRILSHKGRKIGKKGASTKHHTRSTAAGGAAPLPYGEERTAVRQGHGQGAPGRIIGAANPAADPPRVHLRRTPCRLMPL